MKNQWKGKDKQEKDGIVRKQIMHLSHLLVPQYEIELMLCLTFTGALAQSDALALWSTGASLLEVDQTS